MIPEEKFNSEMWQVLQKIRYISISAREGEALEWVMQARPIMSMPPIGVRQRMLLKIEEFGGIKIIDEKVTNDTYGRDFIYTFKLLQPKFDEIYEKYNKIFVSKSEIDGGKQNKNNILLSGIIKNNAVVGKGASLIKFQGVQNKEKNKKNNFWERPWFQMIMLLSAIATIIGLFLSF